MLIILTSLTACQETLVIDAPHPTGATLPAQSSPPPTLIAAPTRAARDVPVTENVSPTPDATFPPALITQVLPTVPLSESAARTALPAPTAPALATLNVASSGTVAPNATIIGQSVQGRAITAHRFGTGAAVVLLVGGVHGGWEANTVDLMNALIAHFTTTPSDIPAGVAVVIVPALNPDGLQYARDVQGRFNANGVDLNRNWGCEWSPRAVFQAQEVNPGGRAFSEPETIALAAYIRDVQPAAALFYHSAADGVFGGSCAGGTSGARSSAALEALYGETAGYEYGEPFTAYPVTGTAPSWLDGQGIPAADVELASWQEPEFERNLLAVLAVLAWVAGE